MARKLFCIPVLLLGLNMIHIPVALGDEGSRMVEIILDASGSMNARLADGQLKITAAKEAVVRLAQQLPDDLVIAFRAYGHQSPREKKDCRDTALLVDFSPLKGVRTRIIEASGSLKAQGYTPITYALGLAAEDFPDEKKVEKIIVLVSDGNETCEADPCLAAKKLKEADVKLTVHTIGFGVNAATSAQLQCIAHATGGKYFAALSMEELIAVLSEAVRTSSTVVVKEKGTGWLKIEGADLRGHDVINAETGEKAAFLSHTKDVAELEAGIYNVTVAKAVWKSIEVKAGETTVIRPGVLLVRNASYRGHKVLEAETGEEAGMVSSSSQRIALIPGAYLVTFGKATWAVTIDEGKEVVLNPGVVDVDGASYRGHVIRTKDGKDVGFVSNTSSSMALPPGEYTIEIGGKRIPFTLKEGETRTFTIKIK